MNYERQSGIYCIENTVNHKKYIGQSVDLNDRWRRHIGELNRNKHHNSHLQNSWIKYGKDRFIFYVLEYCDVDSLDEKECYYILLYKTIDENYGYNLKSGGQSYNHYSKEIKKKMSKSVKKSYADNPELIDKRKFDAIDYWSNPDNSKKHSGENNGMYGKKHTDEAKEKMRIKRKNRTNWNCKPRPVFCIELNRKFNSAGRAAKELNLASSNILNVCYGKRQTCGGFHWAFINN